MSQDRDASLVEVRACCDLWQSRSFLNSLQIVSINQARDLGSGLERKGWYQISLGIDERMEHIYCKDPGHVHLRSDGEWIDLGCYLQRLMMMQPDPTLNDRSQYSQEVLYAKQWSWWEKNGKKFPFMCLPAELREAIYDDLFTQDTDLPLKDMRRHPKLPWLRRRPFLQSRFCCRGIGILFLNHRVFKEASHVFYRNVNFVVESNRVLRLLEQTPAFTSIRNLTLDLQHFDYLRLFGLTFEEQTAVLGDQTFDDVPHESSVEAKVLRAVHLRCLRFNIRSPFSMSLDGRLQNAYHNEIVSAILTRAWPLVKGHPVVLSGYADDRLVLRFRAGVDAARKQHDAWFLEQSRWKGLPATLEEYDEWAAEEDGGVRVDGQDQAPPPSEAQLLEEMTTKQEKILSEKKTTKTLMLVDDDEPKGFD